MNTNKPFKYTKGTKRKRSPGEVEPRNDTNWEELQIEPRNTGDRVQAGFHLPFASMGVPSTASLQPWRGIVLPWLFL